MTAGTDCYLDRFEGETAVLLLNGSEVAVPRSALPAGAAEGDHLHVCFTINDAAREETSRQVTGFRRKLKEKGVDR
ncbi:hypothetical protein BMS3Abin01_00677 [bacterium BMS3Abin01]|nr:hypothetical protein BMS3Abin01_00677 [bacterium BMS3Abin01]HDY69390.1 DUF3006 domain-containing protein [Actinomycetota bacterium]